MKKKIKGTQLRPRLSVYRSNKHIYAQVIDDNKALTLFSFSTLNQDTKETLSNGQNCEAARRIGEKLAKILLENNVKKVIFDRGKRPYHGRIKSLADGARSKGLEF